MRLCGWYYFDAGTWQNVLWSNDYFWLAIFKRRMMGNMMIEMISVSNLGSQLHPMPHCWISHNQTIRHGSYWLFSFLTVGECKPVLIDLRIGKHMDAVATDKKSTNPPGDGVHCTETSSVIGIRLSDRGFSLVSANDKMFHHHLLILIFPRRCKKMTVNIQGQGGESRSSRSKNPGCTMLKSLRQKLAPRLSLMRFD